jgi:transcriptional regulator with XRE-family HTH domain
MNQSQFAKKAGLSKSFVSRWLSGQKRPGYETAKRLVERFGQTLEFWIESNPDRIRVFIERLPENE